MSPDRVARPALATGRTCGLLAFLALASLVGVAAGVVAQLLVTTGGAISSFGAATAPWVAIGFIYILQAARRWSGRDRPPWMCVVAAAYLFGWLVAYHVLYGALERPPVATVWAESRLWVAAVAPACVTLGCLAVGSLRPGTLGDACLAAPLAWSLPESVAAVHSSVAQVVLFTVPTLLIAVIPLATARRRWSPTTVTITALLGGAALAVVLPSITRVVNSMG